MWTLIVMTLCKCNWSVNVFMSHLSCDINQFTCGLKKSYYKYIASVFYQHSMWQWAWGDSCYFFVCCIWSLRALTCTVYSQVPTIPLPLAVLKIQPEVLKPLEVWILYWTSFVINGLFTFTFCANSPQSMEARFRHWIITKKRLWLLSHNSFLTRFFHRIQNYYLNTSW